MTKQCKKCSSVRPLDEFHRDPGTKDGRRGICKDCACAKAKAWYKANPEQARAARYRYAARNREKLNAQARDRWNADPQHHAEIKRKSRYRVVPERYGEMMVKQRGRCAICMREAPQLHLDHDHKTGAVRGLLCPACNHGLGRFRDNRALLERAISYLKSPPGAA